MLLLDGCLCVALGQGDFLVWLLAVKIKVNFLSNYSYMFIHTANIVYGAAKFVKLYCRKLCFLGGFTSLPSFQDCSNKHIHAMLRIRDPRWKIIKNQDSR
jgi:hypothetical protein